MNLVNHILSGLPPALVYLVVGAVVVAESAFVAGIPLPAATSLIALGLAANAGTVRPVPAFVVALAAACLGGTLGYLSGRRGGERARTSRAGRWINERHWDRAARILTRHGGRAVFIGQWVAGARTLVPRLAGINRLPYAQFARWHMPAAVLWTSWLVAASYFAGASYDRLAAGAGRAGGALAVLVLLIGALIVAGRWFAHHPGPIRAVSRLLRRRVRRYGHGHLVADVILAVMLLTAAATTMVFVVPSVIRWSGLDAVDGALAAWARGQWTPGSTHFASNLATVGDPAVLAAVAGAGMLARWYLRGPRQVSHLLRTLAPVLLLLLLGQIVDATLASDPSTFTTNAWMPPEFRWLPENAADALTTVAGAETAELTAAVCLIDWLLAEWLNRPWRIIAGITAATWVTTSAGAWVFLGWSPFGETVAAILIGAAWTALNLAAFTMPPPRVVSAPIPV